MNVTTATNSQSIHTYERHRGGASFDLVKKTTGSFQNEKIRKFDNNLDGTGDAHLIPNNSDGASKGVRPMKSGDIPSYLQTTLSYRMKCVHKPKNDPGDGLRIPFVVGNYANKSHNVGSKIQETLSLIKGAPKRLLEKAKKEKEELGNLVRCMTAGPASPLSHSHGNITRHDVTIMKRNSSANSMDTRTTTIDCHKNHQFRTVLMNLHDELTKMNNKYDELRNSLKAKYDVEVARQIMNLEEELNAKDVEINAFVNLFNEVIQLKKRLSRTGGLKNQPTHTQVHPEGGSEDGGLRAYRKKLDQLNNAKNKVY